MGSYGYNDTDEWSGSGWRRPAYQAGYDTGYSNVPNYFATEPSVYSPPPSKEGGGLGKFLNSPWGGFAASQGLGLIGKGLSYAFGGQRKEAKAADAEYKGDRKRIEAGMSDSPFSLAGYQTYAVRGAHNYFATASKQMADIADVNALDVRGALAEDAAAGLQNNMGNAFVQRGMAMFDNRARSRQALLQASAQRRSQAYA